MDCLTQRSVKSQFWWTNSNFGFFLLLTHYFPPFNPSASTYVSRFLFLSKFKKRPWLMYCPCPWCQNASYIVELLLGFLTIYLKQHQHRTKYYIYISWGTAIPLERTIWDNVATFRFAASNCARSAWTSAAAYETTIIRYESEQIENQLTSGCVSFACLRRSSAARAYSRLFLRRLALRRSAASVSLKRWLLM